MIEDAPVDVPPIPDPGEDEDVAVRTLIPDAWERLRAAMTHGAGLIRTEASLRDATAAVDELAAASSGSLRAAAVAAGLVCRSAIARDESRGVHFRADDPQRKDEWDGRHVSLRLQ
jgi:L-aspartate oxidase